MRMVNERAKGSKVSLVASLPPPPMMVAAAEAIIRSGLNMESKDEMEEAGVAVVNVAGVG